MNANAYANFIVNLYMLEFVIMLAHHFYLVTRQLRGDFACKISTRG